MMARNYFEKEKCMYCNRYTCCCGEELNQPQFLEPTPNEPQDQPKPEPTESSKE